MTTAEEKTVKTRKTRTTSDLDIKIKCYCLINRVKKSELIKQMWEDKLKDFNPLGSIETKIVEKIVYVDKPVEVIKEVVVEKKVIQEKPLAKNEIRAVLNDSTMKKLDEYLSEENLSIDNGLDEIISIAMSRKIQVSVQAPVQQQVEKVVEPKKDVKQHKSKEDEEIDEWLENLEENADKLSKPVEQPKEVVLTKEQEWEEEMKRRQTPEFKYRLANNPALRRLIEEEEEAKNTGEFTLREQRLDRAIREILEKRKKQNADPSYVLTPEDELDRMLYSDEDLAFEEHVAAEWKKYKAQLENERIQKEAIAFFSDNNAVID